MENKVKELLQQSENRLETKILNDLLEKEKEDKNYGAKGYLKDLMQSGCQSGMVSDLIYYKDTNAFFKEYSEEIDELREEAEEITDEPLKIGTPLTNWLAWFGYEEMARKIADKLGLEL